MRRYKNTIGRIIIELMWSDLVTWNGDRGSVNITDLSRKIHTRPVRLVSTLKEMETLGYLNNLLLDYKTIYYTINWKRSGSSPRWG